MLDAQTSPMIDTFACKAADTSLTPIIQSTTSSLLVRLVEFFWGYTEKFGEADVSSFHNILLSDHKRGLKCKKARAFPRGPTYFFGWPRAAANAD